ncbi:Cytochrome b561/ferric reductase transmembrane [Sarocladium implicatum]|nr:Cytochrome b561/ferric reductase transmembrane [Sarocladium implicatum]
MAPTPDDVSPAGGASYDSDTMNVGDGTWDFSKNTFLLPNLASPNFDTMRYNGMANRFSTLGQYHSIILAHAVLAALVFLLLVPFSIFTARFYTGRPGYAVKFHAQIHIFAGLLLLVVFILGNFAVGPKRSLTNPHHGIGVAIFVLFILQIIGGRLVKNIKKLRSLRVTIHQWSGRAIALLGIVQIPLGLTLYGSPKYLFILYALWMAFLFLLYFILDFRSPSRREVYSGEARPDGGNYRVTESEYLSETKPHEESSKWKWLGPLAAGTGIWALLRRRNKKKESDFENSSYRSDSRSRGPEVIPSRRGSSGYYEEEKYTDVSAPRKSGGGGFMKYLGGAAAAVGAGALASKLMNRGKDRDDEYSAVSTETPRRYRVGRETEISSEWSSEAPTRYRRDEAESSLLPPAAGAAAMAGARSAADSRLGRPVTPTRPSHARQPSRRSFEDYSEYSSYVSPSRREPEPGRGGGMAKGILAGLGMGWFTKKLADRRAKKQDERLRQEEEMRGGSSVSRFTGDGFPSPSRRQSQRPGARGPTGLHSEITESSIEPRPHGGYGAPPPPLHAGAAPAGGAVPVPVGGSHSRSRSRHGVPPATMPPMPDDPLYSGAEDSYLSSDARPTRRPSSRRRRAGEAASAAAAARAAGLAADEVRSYGSDRDRYASPTSQPVSVKLKMHDDRDRNVTLRRLTEEEARAAAGSRARADSDTSLSGMESPSAGRSRYRRDASAQRRAERAAERRVEAEDKLAPLSPPNPAFAKGRRAKDSAYYSGAQSGPGPSGSTPAAGQTMSSLGSLASPESHGTWSGVSASPSGPEKPAASAADNRRRRRLERRRGSSAARPVGTDMFD